MESTRRPIGPPEDRRPNDWEGRPTTHPRGQVAPEVRGSAASYSDRKRRQFEAFPLVVPLGGRAGVSTRPPTCGSFHPPVESSGAAATLSGLPQSHAQDNCRPNNWRPASRLSTHFQIVRRSGSKAHPHLVARLNPYATPISWVVKDELVGVQHDPRLRSEMRTVIESVQPITDNGMVSAGRLQSELMHSSGGGHQPHQRGLPGRIESDHVGNRLRPACVRQRFLANLRLRPIGYLSQPIDPSLFGRQDSSDEFRQIDFFDFATSKLVTEQAGGAFAKCDQHQAAHRSVQTMGKRQVVPAPRQAGDAIGIPSCPLSQVPAWVVRQACSRRGPDHRPRRFRSSRWRPKCDVPPLVVGQD